MQDLLTDLTCLQALNLGARKCSHVSDEQAAAETEAYGYAGLMHCKATI
jgi:hypothetical protein